MPILQLPDVMVPGREGGRAWVPRVMTLSIPDDGDEANEEERGRGVAYLYFSSTQDHLTGREVCLDAPMVYTEEDGRLEVFPGPGGAGSGYTVYLAQSTTWARATFLVWAQLHQWVVWAPSAN